MILLRRDRARKRLRDALAIAADEPFLQMIWAINALHAGRSDLASRLIEIPPEAVQQAVGDQLAIHAWELETLVNQLILTAKNPGRRYYPCRTFSTAAEFTNYLRNAEDAEYAAEGNPEQILNELHRIGQRQFPWQRQAPNLPDFYRPLYLYGQGGCAEAFERAYQLTVSQFALVGFALYATFMARPYVSRQLDLTRVGISPEQLEAALRLISIDAAAAPAALRRIVQDAGANTWPMAYKPSLLRSKPVFAFGNQGERLRAPLPHLILQRATFGLYYDVFQPGGALRNEIAMRFEHYAADLIRAMMPGFDVEHTYAYLAGRGRQIDAPDVLVSEAGALAVVIECKATKLTLAAQFSEDPAVDAQTRYAEIGKGIFQVWRFFAHCRLGRTRHQITPQTRGLLLTLDTWLVMARELQDHVRQVAAELADADQEILEQDRRPVLFAAIQDFEGLLSQTDEQGFLRTLDAGAEERFLGWILPNISRDLGPLIERKKYPFAPDELVPWWGQLRAIGD